MIIPSPNEGSAVNHLMGTWITVHGAGPLSIEEIKEILDWCNKQKTEIVLNSTMQTFFNFEEEIEEICSREYSMWFEDPDTATYFKMKWA